MHNANCATLKKASAVQIAQFTHSMRKRSALVFTRTMEISHCIGIQTLRIRNLAANLPASAALFYFFF